MTCELIIMSGIEWSLDTDASNATVLVASEAHAITLAIEGLLGVVFAVATLTDEAVDDGEVRYWTIRSSLGSFTSYLIRSVFMILLLADQLESPRCDTDPPTKCTGITATLCMSMVDLMWLTILDALSLILMKYVGSIPEVILLLMK